MCETVADTTSFEIFSLFATCYFGTYEISVRKKQRGNQEWTTQRQSTWGTQDEDKQNTKNTTQKTNSSVLKRFLCKTSHKDSCA